MMILGNFTLCLLGAALVGLAAPSHAAAPQASTEGGLPAQGTAHNAHTIQSRRVELPFPLKSRAPNGEPRDARITDDAAPHPFRELRLKRASLQADDSRRYRSLSCLADFS